MFLRKVSEDTLFDLFTYTEKSKDNMSPVPWDAFPVMCFVHSCVCFFVPASNAARQRMYLCCLCGMLKVYHYVSSMLICP